jgi:hypothetical protein
MTNKLTRNARPDLYQRPGSKLGKLSPADDTNIKRWSNGIVVLADVSVSMETADCPTEGTYGYERRIDALGRAMKRLRGSLTITFSDDAKIVPFDHFDYGGYVEGGTVLAPAIELAVECHKRCPFPQPRTIIISDGEPEDEGESFRRVKDLPGKVDVIYCGPAHNHKARRFLESLAKEAGGTYAETDATKQLSGIIAGLLPAARKP